MYIVCFRRGGYLQSRNGLLPNACTITHNPSEALLFSSYWTAILVATQVGGQVIGHCKSN